MSDTIFHDPPHVELLRSLSRGSLKQNLLRAIRLWAWLRLLYSEHTRHQLAEPFTWADCRIAFFSASHPKGEQAPSLHDPHCICAKTTANWLFETQAEPNESQWRQKICQQVAIAGSQLDELLRQRLFGVTRRSLSSDLKMLAQLGWLQSVGQQYRRVTCFPVYPIADASTPPTLRANLYEFDFLHPDLAGVAQDLAQAINGVQRFFLHADYIVSQEVVDRVEDWQALLRQVWEQAPVAPILLRYNSARQRQLIEEVVYPVCIYYAQRAIYLCGFNPDRQHNWYNYRLDRIEQIESLYWDSPQVPQKLRQDYQQQSLPTPDVIRLAMSQAWGFDFYLPAQLLLLRFEREFHDFYIKDTFRHETFQAISNQKAQRLIKQQQLLSHQEQQLLQVLTMRSPKDKYYQAQCRVGDTNIQHRLRAWRPHCEVLLPWSLRQNMAEEVATEFQFYQG